MRADAAATFPRAWLEESDTTAQHWLDTLRPTLERPGSEALSPPLDLRGTVFQRLVWHALRQIPAGTTCSYRQLADLIGRPRATRAVAGACAANPVGVIVPCHRVVRSNGGLGGYHWGVSIKRDLLRREGALQPPSEGSD